MIKPERGFMRSLKSLDKRLDCVFRPSCERFVITYNRGYGEPVNLLLVKDDSGGFRQPDNRDLKIIYDGDMANKKPEIELSRRAYEIQRSADRQEQKTRELIRERTKDDKIQLMDVFQRRTGIGKKKAAFRPIAYKPKGIVYGQTNS
jgi:hypothetical protein